MLHQHWRTVDVLALTLTLALSLTLSLSRERERERERERGFPVQHAGLILQPKRTEDKDQCACARGRGRASSLAVQKKRVWMVLLCQHAGIREASINV